MFVHCKKCDWMQDDFWSETYNPIKHLRNSADAFFDQYKEGLLREKLKVDPNYYKDTGLDPNNTLVIDYYVRLLEDTIQQIKNPPHYKNMQEVRDADCKCPECGEELTAD